MHLSQNIKTSSKIVYESLLEFRRGENPSEVLKLGKKKDVEEWLRQYIYSSAYKINTDWTIDILKDFIVPSGYNTFVEIPEFIQFNECHGDFLLRDNNLKSMEGCPRIVHGDFMVDGNKLEDLDGSPIQVDGSYYIKRNKEKFDIEQIKKICKVGERIVV